VQIHAHTYLFAIAERRLCSVTFNPMYSFCTCICLYLSFSLFFPLYLSCYRLLFSLPKLITCAHPPLPTYQPLLLSTNNHSSGPRAGRATGDWTQVRSSLPSPTPRCSSVRNDSLKREFGEGKQEKRSIQESERVNHFLYFLDTVHDEPCVCTRYHNKPLSLSTPPNVNRQIWRIIAQAAAAAAAFIA